jgi:hypothetical protein
MGLPFYSKRTAQCSRYHFDISAYHFDIAARDMASNCAEIAEIAAKERRDSLEKTKATASTSYRRILCQIISAPLALRT